MIRHFKRRRFYAAGVNDIWAQDQHDKWGPRFGFWLHVSINPFTGYNNRLKVWSIFSKSLKIVSNDSCSSRCIVQCTAFQLEYLSSTTHSIELAIPLTTQSDLGTENYSVASVQTLLRHQLDPTLVGSLQHRWKRNNANVKSEANCSVFRRDFALGFEDLFEQGENHGWYDVNNPLEK
jgi:hypothetical protein